MLWDFNYLWTSNKKFCSCRNDVIEFFVHVISIGILFTVDFVHVHSIIVTTKLPARMPAWENLQEVFAMLVVVVFYLTGGFSFYCLTASATVLSGRFLPTVLPYTPLFVAHMRTGTPFSRILLCFCPHRVVPSGWRVDLNYWCLNYETIYLSIAAVSHEV